MADDLKLPAREPLAPTPLCQNSDYTKPLPAHEQAQKDAWLKSPEGRALLARIASFGTKAAGAAS